MIRAYTEVPMAESTLQKHERLVKTIEKNTQSEGLVPPQRKILRSVLKNLSPYHESGILAGTIYAYWDAGVNGLRSRDT